MMALDTAQAPQASEGEPRAERISQLDALRMQLALGAYDPRAADIQWAEDWYARFECAWNRERPAVASACLAEVGAHLDGIAEELSRRLSVEPDLVDGHAGGNR